MYNDTQDDYIRSVLGYPRINEQEFEKRYPYNYYDMQSQYDYNYNSNYNPSYEQNHNSNYNQNYEPNYSPNYEQNYRNNYDLNFNTEQQNRNAELEDEYPEIYKIIYPMVKKACRNVSGTVTKDDVDRIVEEVYSNIEGNEQINLNINVNNIENNIENLKSVQVENRNTSVANKEVKQNCAKEYCQTRMYNGKKIVEEPKMPERMAKTATKESENRSVEKENRGGGFCKNGLCDIIRILLLRELIGNQGRPRVPIGRPPFPPQGRPPFPPPQYRSPFQWDKDIYEY